MIVKGDSVIGKTPERILLFGDEQIITLLIESASRKTSGLYNQFTGFSIDSRECLKLSAVLLFEILLLAKERQIYCFIQNRRGLVKVEVELSDVILYGGGGTNAEPTVPDFCGIKACAEVPIYRYVEG